MADEISSESGDAADSSDRGATTTRRSVGQSGEHDRRHGQPPTAPYDPESLIGSTIGGRYLVQKCIGQGGMGVVYLASQTTLDRKVVVKVLPRSVGQDSEASNRFEREARGMSRLQHPNIVSIYDFGYHADQAYICMEFIDGKTLSTQIKRSGAMALEEFAPIGAQLLAGIGGAHAMGLIHRDIKPSNIMLTRRHGQQHYVKILDFGLAKLVKNGRQVTKEQSLVGSTAFLSPEQILGHDIDQRIDIYALGVLFFYMLTGVKPFDADEDINILYQHVHHAPPPLGDVIPGGHNIPDELVALIERMLAKDPDDRPMDAGGVHTELDAIMSRTSPDTPWISDELKSLSPSSSPSDIRDTDTNRHGWPTAPSAPDTPLPAQAPQLSEEGSYVTEEQLSRLQQASSRRGMLTTLVALLVVGAGVGAFLALGDEWWGRNGSEGPVQTESSDSSMRGGEPGLAGEPNSFKAPGQSTPESTPPRRAAEEGVRHELIAPEDADRAGGPDAQSQAEPHREPSSTAKSARPSPASEKPSPRPKSRQHKPAARADKPEADPSPSADSDNSIPSSDDAVLLPVDEPTSEGTSHGDEPTNDDVPLLPMGQ